MSIKLNAQKVRQLRKELLWSQEDLAEGSGLSVRTIQRIEKNAIVSVDTLQSLAAAFNIAADDLILTAGKDGLRRGTRFGFLGVGLGTLFAVAGIVYDAMQNGLSGYDAGLSAGIVGLLAGLSCAGIGLSSRYLERKAENA